MYIPADDRDPAAATRTTLAAIHARRANDGSFESPIASQPSLLTDAHFRRRQNYYADFRLRSAGRLCVARVTVVSGLPRVG